MSFASDMYAYLQTQAAFETVLGSDSSMRFWAANAPELTSGTNKVDIYPRIVWRRLQDAPIHHLTAAGGHSVATYSFDCQGLSHEDAVSAAEALRAEMDGFQGVWNTNTKVRRCDLISEVEDYIPDGDGSERGTFVVTQDYEIAYVRSVPTFA